MSRTLPLTKNFDAGQKIGIVIIDDEVKIGVNDIISVEFITTNDHKLKLDSFSVIEGAKYCAFREDSKEQIEQMKNIEVI